MNQILDIAPSSIHQKDTQAPRTSHVAASQPDKRCSGRVPDSLHAAHLNTPKNNIVLIVHGGRSELCFEKEVFSAVEGRVSYLHMLTKHHLELCLLLTTAKLTVLLHFDVCLQQRKCAMKVEGIFLISDTRRMGEKNKQSQGNIFTLTFLKHTWPLGACGVGDLERARTEQWIGESPFSYFKKIGALATSTFATSFQKYQSALPRGEGFVSNSASFRLWGCGPPCDRARPRL